MASEKRLLPENGAIFLFMKNIKTMDFIAGIWYNTFKILCINISERDTDVKKRLNAEWLLCIFSLPVLWFLFSRMGTFFLSAFGFEFREIYRWVGVLLSEILIVVFRKKIADYLWNGVSLKTAITLFSVSFLLALLSKDVFLRGCEAGGDIICLIGAAFLLGIFLMVLSRGTMYLFGRAKTVHISKKSLIFAGAVWLTINLASVLYCVFLRKIFTWDNAGYFITVLDFDTMFPGLSYWEAVYQSIFETDYNYIIMIPASLFCKLFGKSRLVFILSIVNCYIYPILMLIYACGKRYFQLSNWKIVCIYLCLPYLMFAANTGFIDVGGIIPALLALILYCFGRREKHGIIIGLFLALAVYFRRWYSFFALSFLITSVLCCFSKKNIRCFLESFGSFVFVLLFFTQDFVSTKLLADYRYIYSAYNLGIHTDMMTFTRYYGLFLTSAVSLFAIAKQIFNRRKLHAETFILFQAVLMFFLFVSVQTHGQQHLSLYIPAFAMLLLSLWKQVNRKLGIVAIVTVSSLQTVNTFIPREQPTSIQEINQAAILPDFSMYPPVDPNVDGILKITAYMDKEIGGKGKKVCFLASSLKLNYETLRNAEISVSLNQSSQIDRSTYYYGISDVDKRNNLSESLFWTDYILVPSTLQIHLAEEEQRVIAVPYYEITGNYGIGTAYQKEEITFPLADGTEIYLYRQIREVTPEEIEGLRERIFNPAP